MVLYFITLVVAFIVTYLTTPIIQKIAIKINAVDLPGERKIHLLPVPRLGGVGIYLGFVAAVITSLIISNYYNINLDLKAMLGIFAIPLTLFWVVGITNAINLIDGLDGLATGVTAISAATLFFVALRTHQLGAAILLIALLGTSLAFLRFNFFPATIFLGDSGALFLGFILASASIIGVLKTTLVAASRR